MPRVAVVGAGIVGSSVAFRLAESGRARVWLVDGSAGPGGGTTSASFAWANANDKTPRDYFELNRAGLEEHYRLRDELPPTAASAFHPVSNLEWAADDKDLEGLDRRVERLRGWGYAAEWLTASRVNETLKPGVAFPSPRTPIAFFPDEGWVDAPWLVETLVRSARELGAEAHFGAAVEGIEVGDGAVSAVRLRGGERIRVDVVVNAAGPRAGEVAALVGRALPMRPSEGLLARLALREDSIGCIVHSPHANLRPDGPGHVLVHHGSVDAKLGEDAEAADRLSDELLERASAVVPALKDARVEDAWVGVRPVPGDGLPCVGAVPGLPGYYEAVSHSGVTLGPLLGRLLAREVLDGEADDLLVPAFRPGRFPGRAAT